MSFIYLLALYPKFYRLQTDFYIELIHPEVTSDDPSIGTITQAKRHVMENVQAFECIAWRKTLATVRDNLGILGLLGAIWSFESLTSTGAETRCVQDSVWSDQGFILCAPRSNFLVHARPLEELFLGLAFRLYHESCGIIQFKLKGLFSGSRTYWNRPSMCSRVSLGDPSYDRIAGRH
ncbi:hypothetical protein VNO77_44642 [Canavalia gladiata]|uniref:Uncharacterized protein n=1 Tax=Canavalia gladiata TaxID=3824 RepID=A0AAN9JYG2_CANGL